MAQQLTNLSVREVSLVDEPANPHAKALIAKRKEPALIAKLRDLITGSFGKDAGTKFENVILPAIEKDATDFSSAIGRSETERAVWSLQSSLCSIIEDDDMDAAAKKDMLTQSFDQFLAYLGDKLTTAESTMTAEQEAAEKAAKAAANCDPKKQDTGAAVVPGDKGGKPNMEDGEMTEEDMKKSLDAAVTKARAEVTAEFEKKFEAQAAEITKLRDEADLRDRMEKARTLADGQSLYTAEQLADLMKSLGTEGFKVIEASLTKAKAQEAAVAKTLYAEVGTQSYGKAQSSFEKLKAKADEYAKADPKLTDAGAFAKAMDKHPDLYREFKATQG